MNRINIRKTPSGRLSPETEVHATSLRLKAKAVILLTFYPVSL